MKYIITDKDEAKIGGGYHHDLASGCKGEVVRAGHCEKLPDGSYKVWGRSIGFRINSREDDAKLLEEFLVKEQRHEI